MALSLGFIVSQLGGELYGDSSLIVSGLAPLETADADHISFLSNPKYQSQLQTSRAGCIVVAPAVRDVAVARGNCIVTDNPYLYFAKLSQLWKRPVHQGIHPSAVIDPEADIHPTASIGALCVVEKGARIGAHTVLKSRVTVGEDCTIGARCILHSGVVIGADGFGFAPRPDKSWEKIEQLGAVRIGDDVEIGANTCIDRGALSDTVIENGVKLDNLIQIAHNVHIGKHTAMAGCTGVAGSAVIGAYCTIGGSANILGHLTLGDGVSISVGTLVSHSLLKPGQYTGIFPVDDNATWERNAATLKQLYKLRERIKVLEKNVKNKANKTNQENQENNNEQ